MLDYLFQFASRLAVMLPAILFVSWVTWHLLNRFGALTPDAPFNASDTRTWPLGFMLIEAAAFAVIFAAVLAVMEGSDYGVGIASGLSVLIVLVIGPRIAAKVLR
jgi:hypothetical protein